MPLSGSGKERNGTHGWHGGDQCVVHNKDVTTIYLGRNIFRMNKIKRVVLVTIRYAMGLAILNIMLGLARSFMWKR
jgi:hypothetical protein